MGAALRFYDRGIGARLYKIARRVYSLVLQTINNKRFKIDDLNSFQNEISAVLYPEEKFSSYPPQVLTTDRKVTMVTMPPVCIFNFKSAIVDANASAFIYKNKLVTYRTENERFNEGFIVANDSKTAKVGRKPLETIEDGYFLCGNGSWNWYHFLIEIAPKILLLDKERTPNILVSDIVLSIPSMLEVLNIVNEQHFKIIYLSKDKNYEVKNLFYVSPVSYIPFNSIKSEGGTGHSFFREEVLHDFSRVIKIYSNKHFDDKFKSGKIMLYRNSAHRIAKNQEEVFDFLSTRGFVKVALEELTFIEQVQLFSSARFIVGISGAAWSNLIFCSPGVHAICFSPDNAKDFVAFSNLAEIYKVNLYYMYYESLGRNHFENGFEINIKELKTLYEYLSRN